MWVLWLGTTSTIEENFRGAFFSARLRFALFGSCEFHFIALFASLLLYSVFCCFNSILFLSHNFYMQSQRAMHRPFSQWNRQKWSFNEQQKKNVKKASYSSSIEYLRYVHTDTPVNLSVSERRKVWQHRRSHMSTGRIASIEVFSNPDSRNSPVKEQQLITN